jgi:hypothetical protein
MKSIPAQASAVKNQQVPAKLIYHFKKAYMTHFNAFVDETQLFQFIGLVRFYGGAVIYDENPLVNGARTLRTVRFEYGSDRATQNAFNIGYELHRLQSKMENNLPSKTVGMTKPEQIQEFLQAQYCCPISAEHAAEILRIATAAPGSNGAPHFKFYRWNCQRNGWEHQHTSEVSEANMDKTWESHTTQYIGVEGAFRYDLYYSGGFHRYTIYSYDANLFNKAN